MKFETKNETTHFQVVNRVKKKTLQSNSNPTSTVSFIPINNYKHTHTDKFNTITTSCLTFA